MQRDYPMGIISNVHKFSFPKLIHATGITNLCQASMTIVKKRGGRDKKTTIYSKPGIDIVTNINTILSEKLF